MGSIVSIRVSQCPQINMIFYLVIVLTQSPRSRHMFIRKVCAVYKAGLFSLLGFKRGRGNTISFKGEGYYNKLQGGGCLQ